MKLFALIAASMLLAIPSVQACNLHATDAKASGCPQKWMNANLRLNDILTVGTHNSYKQAIPPALLAKIASQSPQIAAGLDYSHPPLNEELDDGARNLELDVVYDPEGGRYAAPAGIPPNAGALPADFIATMAKPGFKVLHVPDIDVRSSCLTLTQCLTIIRHWSRAHPQHIPILITMNAKDDPSQVPGGVQPLKFDAAAYNALDAEIASVFPESAMIRPRDVIGKDGSLHWPTLGTARGKVLFALDEPPEKVIAYESARGGKRVMFINAPDPEAEGAAYVTLNEVPADLARIKDAVAGGLIVRTRADADTVEARRNDPSRRDAAFASGAQYVSTDYRHPDVRFGPYEARLPDGAVAVCNPLRTGDQCRGIAIDP